MMDRSLLANLSQCAWKVLNLYLTQAIAYDDAKAGAAVAVQSFGDFQNFNSHLHVKVIYQSKDGTSTKTFDALDWLAQLATHIPNKGESAGGGVRYYGFYSNKSRGLRKKAGTDDAVPALIESEASPKEFRKIGLG